MMARMGLAAAALALALMVHGPAVTQTPASPPAPQASTPASSAPAADDTEQALERYRAMISDPASNPGFLAVDRGEDLWALKRGTRNVSLEGCDLGLGPGVLEGAFAALPRYFADADRVMDLEARLLWCMREVQGLDTTDVVRRRFSAPGRDSDMEALVFFIAEKSSGRTFSAQRAHTREREAIALGEAMFYRRSGPMDFSCQTCHQIDGARIRLQRLPMFDRPEDARATMGSWPTYRVSQNAPRTMQHRLWDCMWQMRLPDVAYTSDLTIALTAYLVSKADGGAIQVPSIKR